MATHVELLSVLHTAAQGIHEVIKNGYRHGSVDIPVLDPLTNLPTFSKKIEVKRAHVELTIKSPVLKGLNTISLAKTPDVDLESRQLKLEITFEQLELSSSDFDMEGTYRILFKHNIDKEGSIDISARRVSAHLVFKLELAEDGPSVVADGSTVEIGDLDVDIEDSIILDLLIPLFKGHITAALSQKLESVVEEVLTAKLRSEYEAQRPMFDKMVALYKLKKEQGLRTDEDGDPERPNVLSGFGGVGQIPLPMFWVVPSVDADSLEHIRIPELMERVQTGDVILFAGTAASSQKIRRWTQSPYSHVTVLIRDRDFDNGKPLLWQSTSSTHRGVLVNMEKRPGVQLNEIEEMIHDYLKEAPGANVVYRSLQRPERDEATENRYREAMAKLIRRADGLPYTDDMWGLGIMGLMEIDVANKDTNFFCAGLVAQTLMDFGILKDNLLQYQYEPRDFCDRQSGLPFVDPQMSYGPEIVLDID